MNLAQYCGCACVIMTLIDLNLLIMFKYNLALLFTVGYTALYIGFMYADIKSGD